MRKTIKLLAVLFLTALTISSCSKKNDDPKPSSSSSPSSPSPSSPSPSPGNNVTDGTYTPTTKDSYWVYKSAGGTVKTSMTGETKTINGKTYYAVKQDGSTQLGYATREGNKYYSYATTSNGVVLDMKTIDLDVKVGESWKYEVQTNTYTLATYTMTLQGTGLTRTVNGKEFKDVIAVQIATTAKLINLPAGIPAEAYNYLLAGTSTTQVSYYAKNVGMIEQTSPMDALNVSLTEYSVK